MISDWCTHFFFRLCATLLVGFAYPYSVFAYGHLAVIPIGLIFFRNMCNSIPLSLNLLCAQFIMQQFMKAFYPF